MTIRAVIIGLILGMCIAVFGYFNDWVIKQAYLATNLAPAAVFGLLLVGLLAVNPLMRSLGLGGFSGAEWAVITGLMLVACIVPGPGLMWHFSNNVVMPHLDYQNNVGWQNLELMGFVPDVMLVDAHGQLNEVVVAFTENEDRLIGFSSVPWGAWRRTLSFWLPFIGMGFIAAICLAVVVHKQWSQREHLRYPIAEVAASFIEGSDEGPIASIFRNRRFWIGFGVPMVILSINAFQAWFPASVRFPLEMDLGPLVTAAPKLFTGPGGWWLRQPMLFFSAVGFAYFVSSEVSFSLGICNIVFAVIFVWLTRSLGLNLTGSAMEGSPVSFQMFGSYVGVGLVVAYFGRHFYAAVVTRLVGLRTRDAVEPHVVWSARVAFLAAVGMVLMLVLVTGLNWFLAILVIALVGLMSLVLTRISVETGLFMIQPGWLAVGVLMGVFGFDALGPQMFIIAAMACLMLTMDPIVALRRE